MFSKLFPENRAVCEIIYVEKVGRDGQATDDNIIRRLRFACWVNEATITHLEYEIFIAFPLQQWLREIA
jgi:hypothetical protein